MSHAVILLPQCAYAWWMQEGGQTRLHKGPKLRVRLHKKTKVTVFKGDSKNFISLGTAIFTATHPKGSSSVSLRWPSYVQNRVSKHAYVKSAASIAVNGRTVDHAPEYHEAVQTLMRNRGAVAGLNKFWKIDWEWPFETPGWVGLREIGQGMPGVRAALPWLEYHALCIMGKQTQAECSPDEWLSVATMALGAAGYLDGYEHEEVDDIAVAWSSFGTGNDCDDFAVATATVVNTARRLTGPPACALEAWVRAVVTDAYVVSGMAWPRNVVKDGKKVTFGHMWCELLTTCRPEPLVVECTAAVAYYGGNPVAKTARTGCIAGANNEYLSRAYHWYADKAYEIKNGERHLLPAPTMPDWFDTLRYTVPEATHDPNYKHPGAPPLPQPLVAFTNTRKPNRSVSKSMVQRAIFPFRVGQVVWHFDTLTGVSNTLQKGAY